MYCLWTATFGFTDKFSLSPAASFQLLLALLFLVLCIAPWLGVPRPPSPLSLLPWNTIFILGCLSPLTLITGWAPASLGSGPVLGSLTSLWPWNMHITIKVDGRRRGIRTWTPKLESTCSSQSSGSRRLPCEKLRGMEWIQENYFFLKEIWDVLAEKAKMVAEALMVSFHLG